MSFRTAYYSRGNWDGKFRGSGPKPRSEKEQKDWNKYNDKLHDETMQRIRQNSHSTNIRVK